MAIFFDRTSSQRLRVDSNPGQGESFTFGCWARAIDVGGEDNGIIGLFVQGATSQWKLVRFDRSLARGGGAIRNTTNIGFNSSTVVNSDEWHHYLVDFVTSTSRHAWVDGTGEVEETTSVTNFDGSIDRFSIGAFDDATPSSYMEGDICECAIWSSTGFTTAEREMLTDGFSPLFVRPQDLVSYWPLRNITDLTDVNGGLTLSVINGPVANSTTRPNIIYPDRYQKFEPVGPEQLEYVAEFARQKVVRHSGRYL